MQRQVIGDLLLGCLNPNLEDVDGARFARLSDDAWREIARLAAAQFVRPLLYHRLKSHHLDNYLPGRMLEQLGEVYRQNSMRNLGLYGELKYILDALKTEDVPVMVLKGLHLAGTIYDNIASRVIGDLDILVLKENLQTTVDVMRALGYEAIAPFSIDVDVAVSHHITRFINHGKAIVEIHWSITNPKRAYYIDVEEIWGRAVPMQVLGFDVLGLCPEDLLLHLCLHTSYQHQFAFGLRSLCDITQVIRHFAEDLNWSQIQQRTRHWDWQRGVYLALLFAKDLLGAAVPEQATNQLKPEIFDEELLQITKSLIFTDRAFSISLSNKLALTFGQNRNWKMLKHLYEGIFKSRLDLAKLYAVSPSSPKIYLYYFASIKDVFLRHARKAWQLLRGDEELTQLADRKNKLLIWLLEES